jgi:D-proline reductase (dithiol) PrdB
MGELSEFPLKYKIFLRTYAWRKIEPVPWAKVRKPLSESRLGLVSSAGLVPPGEEPFDENIRGGDPSFRVIHSQSDPSSFIEYHKSDAFDHQGILDDPNLAFPLDRMHELVRQGRIGSVASNHLSCMGSITAPTRLIKRTAPEAVEIFVRDEVDLALLVPV